MWAVLSWWVTTSAIAISPVVVLRKCLASSNTFQQCQSLQTTHACPTWYQLKIMNDTKSKSYCLCPFSTHFCPFATHLDLSLHLAVFSLHIPDIQGFWVVPLRVDQQAMAGLCFLKWRKGWWLIQLDWVLIWLCVSTVTWNHFVWQKRTEQ